MNGLNGDGSLGGPFVFARFALPPNEQGYCGPSNSPLAEYLHESNDDGGLGELAKAFEGAWPYLQLIAMQSGIGDPLDRRVVEAYWLGGSLGSTIDISAFGESMRDRFSSRSGWPGLSDGLSSFGGEPTHAYHVFNVYPWLGMLRSGILEPGLDVLDRCRIRWGRVTTVGPFGITVTSRRLAFDAGSLFLGPESVEVVTAVPGLAGLSVGDDVALHWGWACARLDRHQLDHLRTSHASALRLANRTAASRDLAG